MRKLIVFLILIAAFFAACKEDDSKGLLDPAKPIKISTLGTRAIDDSVMFVLENAVYIWWIDSLNREWRTDFGTGEDYLQCDGLTRNFENREFLFSGGKVVHEHGLGMFIADCKDVIFTTCLDSVGKTIHPKELPAYWEATHGQVILDTIAYIPNAILLKAQTEIRAAYAIEDFTTCYKLFDEAFVFVPTTGAKWRAMKTAGIE